MAEKKENRGVAFLNKEKSKSTQPDFIGHMDIEGKEYSLAVWLSKSKAKGELYIFAACTDKIVMEPDVEQGRDYYNGGIQPY